MNLDYLAHRLKEVGWKPVPRLTYAGERFQLQFTNRIRLEPWVLLIQSLPVLDIFTLSRYQSRLEWVFTTTKGRMYERNLLLCFVAAKVTQQALHSLKMDQPNLLRFSQKGTGTRKILVVDEASMQVHGPYPPLQPFEKQPPFDLSHLFLHALSPDGRAFPSPVSHDDVASLIDRLLPTSALQLIGDSDRPDLAAARVEALSELGRIKDATESLDALLPHLQGDELARMQRFKARFMFSTGQVDEGIWMLEQAACQARDPQVRAAVISTRANAYAIKNCFRLAEDSIREALQVAPGQPRVSFALAQLYLQTDRRLEARDLLERMCGDTEAWVNSYIDFELANIALLLGEFDEARRLALSALEYSPEIINPLAVLAYLAMLSNDLPEMERLVLQIEARSPQAEMLPPLHLELERLRKRNHLPAAATGPAAATSPSSPQSTAPRQRRLSSFPSLVQRRNHCGPSTIELVLRYWQGGLELTNTDIAHRVMLPGSGTPVYRMTEFFHLVGFDTMRCIAPTDTLKQLVDAGIPAIIDISSGGMAHVTVVIGYDDEAGTIELQDPMTHHVLPMPVDDLNRYRQSLYESAILAFPSGHGHELTLARLGLFPDEVLALLDKASLALELGDNPQVNELMERAARLRPQHGMVWHIWLESLARQWANALDHLTFLPAQSDLSARDPLASAVQSLRGQFYDVLDRARHALPDTDFVFYYAGRAALLDADLPLALAALQKTHQLSPHDPMTLASMAECQFEMRQVDQALESAREALRLDPGSLSGNIWMSRCLSYLHQEHADYYARIGLELAPGWWLAHLAMAEVYLAPRPTRYFQPDDAPISPLIPPQAAWQELDSVLSRAPSCSAALVHRAYLMLGGQDFPSALATLDAALQLARTPMAVHAVGQARCLLFSTQGNLEQALAEASRMLQADPHDPWALQFQADLSFRQFALNLPSASAPPPAELDVQPLSDLYLAAIQANCGDPAVVQQYLGHLNRLGRQSDAIEQAASLRQQFPAQPRLIYLHALLLRQLGRNRPAADAILEALAASGAITDRDGLCYAFETVLLGYGPVEGEQAILNVALPASLDPRDRDVALGIILSFHPKEKGARARQLLEAALADNPEDFEALFWLSNVSLNDAEREAFLKKAVFLAPHWSHARMVLSGFLIGLNRFQDALDFTTGHEYESLDILARHVYSLYKCGYYEQAVPAAHRLVNDPSLPGERISFFYRLKVDVDSANADYSAMLEVTRQALPLFPGEFDWYYYMARALSKLARYDEAAAALDQGWEKGLDPGKISAGKYWIAYDRGDLSAALDIADKEQQQGWKRLPVQADFNVADLVTWCERCLVLSLNQGRRKEAEQLLDVMFSDSRVIESAPYVLSMLRDNQLTLKVAKRLLKLSDLTPGARFNALYAQAVANRNLDDPHARAAFEQLRPQFPLSYMLVAQLALYAALEGDIFQASHLADQAVSQGRHSPEAWAIRGLIRLLDNQPASALADLHSARNRSKDLPFPYPALWWLYFSLQGDIPHAKHYRQLATDQAQSAFDHQLIDVVKSLSSRRAA